MNKNVVDKYKHTEIRHALRWAECASGSGGRGEEREREREGKSQGVSMLSMELDTELDPTTLGS